MTIHIQQFKQFKIQLFKNSFDILLFTTYILHIACVHIIVYNLLLTTHIMTAKAGSKATLTNQKNISLIKYFANTY